MLVYKKWDGAVGRYYFTITKEIFSKAWWMGWGVDKWRCFETNGIRINANEVKWFITNIFIEPQTISKVGLLNFFKFSKLGNVFSKFFTVLRTLFPILTNSSESEFVIYVNNDVYVKNATIPFHQLEVKNLLFLLF